MTRRGGHLLSEGRRGRHPPRRGTFASDGGSFGSHSRRAVSAPLHIGGERDPDVGPVCGRVCSVGESAPDSDQYVYNVDRLITVEEAFSRGLLHDLDWVCGSPVPAWLGSDEQRLRWLAARELSYGIAV